MESTLNDSDLCLHVKRAIFTTPNRNGHSLFTLSLLNGEFELSQLIMSVIPDEKYTLSSLAKPEVMEIMGNLEYLNRMDGILSKNTTFQSCLMKMIRDVDFSFAIDSIKEKDFDFGGLRTLSKDIMKLVIDYRGSDGKTLLCSAVISNRIKIVEELLEYGASEDITDFEGTYFSIFESYLLDYSAVHHAVINGLKEIAGIFGIRDEAFEKSIYTMRMEISEALFSASKKGHSESVLNFIKAGVDLNFSRHGTLLD
jgi:hypothetical protein